MPDSKGSRLLELYDSGMSVRDIAAEMQVSVWQAEVSLRREGIRIPMRATVEDDGRLRELYVVRGFSLREAAVELGVSHIAVRNGLLRLGVELRSRGEGLRGCGAHGRKRVRLNPERVAELRLCKTQGMSERERGRRFGISKTAARMASDGETWGYIPILVCDRRGGSNV